ncbi:MAG: hypothetical protein LBQ12_05695 [Deltaproteobacteria bacterium]|nr:hypothetical protein [Deltaproteobacteria bacterium]
MTDDLNPALPGAARRAFRALGRAGTPESLAALVDIASHRASASGIGEVDYALALERDPAEALAALDVYGSLRPLERRFFEGPRAFEEVPLLVREWSAFAGERRLTALVLGCGRGWSPVSLAASLAAAGLPERSWAIEVNGLDVSPRALALAGSRRYDEADLEGFPYPRGRWFKNEAGSSRRFRDDAGVSLSYGFGDVYLPCGGVRIEQGPPVWGSRKDGRDGAGLPGPDGEAGGAVGGGGGPEIAPGEGPAAGAAAGSGFRENLLWSFRGKVDVLFARNITREAPDERAGALPAAVPELLREGGLCFTAPGEIWPPSANLSLEERNGVFYFRKSASKRKANTFHTPRRGRDSGPAGRSAALPAPDPAKYKPFTDASAAMLPENPEGARGAALEAITAASEDMLAWPPAFEALARAEEGLGRLAFAAQIREAMEVYGRRG